MPKSTAAILLVFLVMASPAAEAQEFPTIYLPFLEQADVVVDGDLAEWKGAAFSDGVWDIDRLRYAPWFDEGRRNRLTDHGDEPHPHDDLRARYYTAWDDTYLYFGAEVVDNVNDVEDPAPADRRWYFKDSICWFMEAPRDGAPEWFGRGDNAFCFLADASYPSFGAWWRHGTPTETYVEEAIPAEAVEYRLQMDPWETGRGDFILEARVEMALVFPTSDPRWQPPVVGDAYSITVIHCDPDGGGYGGHFMVYGNGDNDAEWSRAILTPPLEPLERLPE